MKGCEHCTVKIDNDEWNSLAGAVLELHAALEADDMEWARLATRPIFSVVAAVENGSQDGAALRAHAPA